MTKIKNIDDCYNASHDEASRQGYVSLMRKFIMNDISKLMRQDYDKEVKPDFFSKETRFPSYGEKVRQSIEKTEIYKFWSSLRYNAQEMVWESVRKGVEREIPNLISIYNNALKDKSRLATLELNSDLAMPDYVALRDVHLMPGCWQNEYTKDDPMGLKGTAKVFKAVDISIQIPVENCPINLRHWFKNNDALVKVEKDYRVY